MDFLTGKLLCLLSVTKAGGPKPWVDHASISFVNTFVAWEVFKLFCKAAAASDFNLKSYFNLKSSVPRMSYHF